MTFEGDEIELGPAARLMTMTFEFDAIEADAIGSEFDEIELRPACDYLNTRSPSHQMANAAMATARNNHADVVRSGMTGSTRRTFWPDTALRKLSNGVPSGNLASGHTSSSGSSTKRR